MIASVTADGDDTVTFRLKYPYAPFLHRLTLGVVPSEALAGNGRLDTSPLNTKPVGTGPYHLTDWRKGDRLALRRSTGITARARPSGPSRGVRGRRQHPRAADGERRLRRRATPTRAGRRFRRPTGATVVSATGPPTSAT